MKFEKLPAARTVIFIHFVEGLCTSGPAGVSTKSNPAFVIFQLELVIGKHTCQFSDYRQWWAPGSIELNESLQWMGIGKWTAALLADENGHAIRFVGGLAV